MNDALGGEYFCGPSFRPETADCPEFAFVIKELSLPANVKDQYNANRASLLAVDKAKAEAQSQAALRAAPEVSPGQLAYIRAQAELECARRTGCVLVVGNGGAGVEINARGTRQWPAGPLTGTPTTTEGRRRHDPVTKEEEEQGSSVPRCGDRRSRCVEIYSVAHAHASTLDEDHNEIVWGRFEVGVRMIEDDGDRRKVASHLRRTLPLLDQLYGPPPRPLKAELRGKGH